MEGTISEIRLFAGTFAPRGWEFCQGQLVSIAENPALYSLLGTMYGGDGQTTFGLPDFQGRIATGAGQGGGLSNYALAQMGGVESVTMTTQQMPAHIHSLQGTLRAGNSADLASPEGAFPGNPSVDLYATTPTGATMAPGIVTGQTNVAGLGQPIPLVQPYLALNVIICTEGVFPSRP